MSEVTEGQLREIIAIKSHRDPAFRTSFLSDPKAAVERILGTSLPANMQVSVVEDTDARVHIVIPPMASDELSEDQLEAVSGGFLDATLGSSVLGDGMLCIGGGLINSKMELNL
ncbi:MAG: NHLP leader peptide family RiPP precursor [Verrucomicrobiales bacterium]